MVTEKLPRWARFRLSLFSPVGSFYSIINNQAIQLLLDQQNRLVYDEKWTLLYAVVAPHVEEFGSAITALPASSGKVILLINTALAVVEHDQDAEKARSLLFEALRVNQEVPDNYPFDTPPISEASYPGGLDELVKRIGGGMAQVNPGAALGFMESLGIARWAGGRTLAQVIGAAGKADPEVALQVAANLGRSREWARAMIAEHVAGHDLERALSIWHELDPDDVDKPKALITILQHAPPSAYARAREVIEAEFQPEPKHQLYKIPVLLDLAVNLKRGQPEQARAIVQEGLQSLHDWFDGERWSRPEREFFLARIIPAVTACGFIDLARALTSDISDHFGLQSLAALSILVLRAGEYTEQLREQFHFDASWRTLMKEGRKGSAAELADRRKEALKRRGVDWRMGVPAVLFSLHDTATQVSRGHPVQLGAPGQNPEYVDLLTADDTPGLISIYLTRYNDGIWGPDQVSALLAVRSVSIYGTAAMHFVADIQNSELRQLVLAELYDQLPLEVVLQAVLQGRISQDRLRAIVSLRISARVAKPHHKQGFLDEAFALARNSIVNTDEFTLDLLIEFVREAYQLDAERARQFAGELIASILAAARDSAAHRMFELGACGYTFSADERLALEELSDHWVNRLEHIQEGSIKGPPISDQDAHRLAAIWLARAARSTLPVNRERGLRIVSMASRHADMVAEPTERMRLRRDILKSMLAAGDTTLWEEAVVRSLDFEETTFRTFDWFGQSALKLQREDKIFPPRLLDVIDWAEQLMRV